MIQLAFPDTVAGRIFPRLNRSKIHLAMHASETLLDYTTTPQKMNV
jgi:hypothetical protein